MPGRIGKEFQQETKYGPERMPGGRIRFSAEPGLYKLYPEARKVQLPEAKATSKLSLDEALRSRKSVRSFLREPISGEELSYVLWASTGLQRSETGYDFRTSPSAGALYPIETYLVVNKVEGIPEGVHHYNIKDHSLETLSTGSRGRQLAEAALGQRMCMECPVVFVWTAIFERSVWKYRERAYRYVYMEAGHIAQNLALAAVSVNLGTCQIGAFFDDLVNRIVEVDGERESVLYMSVAGRPG